MSLIRILGRSDRLVTLFIVLALYFYELSFEYISRKTLYSFITIIFIILAVLSKETGIFYALILPCWSILAKGKMLWLGIIILSILFFFFRHLAQFGITIDAGSLNLGFAYLQGLAVLILKGLPIPSDITINSFAVDSFVILVITFAIFLKKSPKSIKFGAAAYAIFIFPFPFYWIQDTILWGFWIWGSLMLAGFVYFIYKKFIVKSSKKLKVVFFSAVATCLFASAMFSSITLRQTSGPLIKTHNIALYVTSTGSGPVYFWSDIYRVFPIWMEELESFSIQEREKKMTYLTELLQIETMNVNSIIR